MLDGGEAIRKLALNLARFTGLAPLARPLVGGIGAILMLHRVTSAPERPNGVNRHLSITPRFLDDVIGQMKSDGYSFVTLDEAVERIKRPRGAGRFATITADDGYRDNRLEALPILRKHGAPIAIFVAPALVDGTAYLWWKVVEEIVAANTLVTVQTRNGPVDLNCSTMAWKFAANTWLHDYFAQAVTEENRHAVLSALAQAHGIDPDAPRRDTLMTWDEVREMEADPLVTIGAHTVNHFILRRLDENAAREEIAAAADIIEAQTGTRPRHLAYPYGSPRAVGCREVALAREAGFVSAVTTRHGVLQAGHVGHVHALPRISINGRYQRVAHIRTMLSGVTTPLANAGKMLVTV